MKIEVFKKPTPIERVVLELTEQEFSDLRKLAQCGRELQHKGVNELMKRQGMTTMDLWNLMARIAEVPL